MDATHKLQPVDIKRAKDAPQPVAEPAPAPAPEPVAEAAAEAMTPEAALAYLLGLGTANHPFVLLAGPPVALLLFAGCSDKASEQSAPDSGAATSTVAHSHEPAGETCFICDASKREPGRLWCTEHARYEDRCWLCQPQLEDKGRLFCEEHGLYEDECHLCRPDPEKQDEEGEQRSSRAAPWWRWAGTAVPSWPRTRMSTCCSSTRVVRPR